MVENSILQHKYSINDFKIGNYIHAGAYGTVYSAIRRSDQREVALVSEVICSKSNYQFNIEPWNIIRNFLDTRSTSQI